MASDRSGNFSGCSNNNNNGCNNNGNNCYDDFANGNRSGRRNPWSLPSGFEPPSDFHRRQPMTSSEQNILTLPYPVLRDLSDLLDVNDRWKSLGGTHMGFTITDLLRIERMARYSSYSMKISMLEEWASLNHTVLELFFCLHDMRMFQAMSLLKEYVSPRYHDLINGPEVGAQMLPPRARPMESAGDSMGYYAMPPTFGNSMGSGGGYGFGYGYESGLPKPPLPVPSVSPSPLLPPPPAPPPSTYHKWQSNKPVPVQDTAYEDVGAAASFDKSMTEYSHCGGHDAHPVSCGFGGPKDSFDLEKLNLDAEHIMPSKNTDKAVTQSLAIASAAAGAAPKSGLETSTSTSTKSVAMPSNAETRTTATESTQKAAETSVDESIVGRIPYFEIVQATDNFTSKELGRGGFGVVFEGRWRKLKVAIKKIEKKENPGLTSLEEAKLRQSYVELETLNRCRYDNVLPLYGYAVDDDGHALCLVYQFMANGSLEDRLMRRGGSEPLDWHRRFVVAHGAARGIQYLHSCVPRIIHGDIKSANILLDVNFEPKIGDFGLAREGPGAECSQSSVKLSAVHGTEAYLPHDFLCSRQLSTKVDTYSFGVVLLELATGLRAFADKKAHRKDLRNHVAEYDGSKYDDLRDRSAGDDRCGAFLMLLIEGRQCTSRRKVDRPEMADVFEYLDAKLRDVVEPSLDVHSTTSSSSSFGSASNTPPSYRSSYSSDRLMSSPVAPSTNLRNMPELTALGTKPPPPTSTSN